jgi:DNA polymerase-3 subunit alpha
MYNSKKKRFTTQCNKEQCELNEGLLKMDFLGLKNLGIFTDTVQNIQSQLGEEIDLRNIPFEDEVFKEIYAKGKTKNVFQFESPGMRKYLKQLNPSNIEDIVAMNALYRPGPMDSIPEFIAAKK